MMTHFSLFAMFAMTAFRMNSVYRSNTAILALGSFLKLFVLMSVWQGLFRGKEAIGGITYNDMMLFVLINLLVGTLTYSRIG
ncbi:hypothetical protein [Paenibacillus sp. 1011MAR3C5]|uniref:hypothetical protein n=1 Tax=Paenibacillus sp. 1011MAR3C5 TaxID=1675787 RepID=UPI0011C41C78|nr:hypothetical protein [Paenibacillus sp. 1011MAR3C5]